MELVVVDRATGQRHAWHSQRVITLPSPDARPQRKVALLAPYPSGWVLYPIVSGQSGPRADRTTVTASKSLRPGTSLRFGKTTLTVERADGSGLPPPPAAAKDRCDIDVQLPGGGRVAVTAVGWVLIGTSELCGLRLPAGAPADPEHLLIAHADGRWFAHDLSGGLLRPLGEEPAKMVQLEPGGAVWSGDLEVVVRFGRRDPLDTLFPEGGAPRPVAAEEASETPSRPAETAGGPAVPAGEPGDPVYAKAHELCGWLQDQLRRPAGSVRRVASAPSWTGDPATDLDRFRTLLAANPHDVGRLLALADMLGRLGYGQLRRWLLKHANACLPGRPELLRGVAEAVADLADESTAAADRTAHLRSAHKYASWAVVAAPDDPDCLALKRRLAKELGIALRVGGNSPPSPL